MNERAKSHYDNAVVLFTAANGLDADVEKTHMLAHLASVSLQLAEFCVANHALVAGIDEDLTPAQTVAHQAPGGVWGAVPVPK